MCQHYCNISNGIIKASYIFDVMPLTLKPLLYHHRINSTIFIDRAIQAPKVNQLKTNTILLKGLIMNLDCVKLSSLDDKRSSPLHHRIHSASISDLSSYTCYLYLIACNKRRYPLPISEVTTRHHIIAIYHVAPKASAALAASKTQHHKQYLTNCTSSLDIISQ